jgi:hypothetical protein
VTKNQNYATKHSFLNKKADCGWSPIANQQRRNLKPLGAGFLPDPGRISPSTEISARRTWYACIRL